MTHPTTTAHSQVNIIICILMNFTIVSVKWTKTPEKDAIRVLFAKRILEDLEPDSKPEHSTVETEAGQV